MNKKKPNYGELIGLLIVYLIIAGIIVALIKWERLL